MLVDPKSVMPGHIIFVFANLKPSQIFYKILPLSQSSQVGKVIILRKEFLDVGEDKIICKAIPKFFRIRPFYWMFVPFYGIYLIRKFQVTLILNYNIFPHGFNAFFSSLFTKRPVIFAEINEDTIKYHQKRFIRPIINKILSNAQYIAVPGSGTENYWKSNGYSKLYRVHSTINTTIFLPGTDINKRYDFIYIGEFDDNKRPDLILDAFIYLKCKEIHATLCMIGFGSLHDSLKAKIELSGLGSSVSLISTHNVLEYLQQSKIFVMASLSEGIPCAMMEAMSCGLVVIVPPVGDIADVVQDKENGYLHNNSKEELTQSMLEAIKNYDNLIPMRNQARETIINGHSYQVATSKWNDLLSKIK
jgi:glycosyltransferase involved in cell wall biosynthesis